ncbi:Retrovirus-related Pol poly from transposon [Brachionus plicatilis]|uniref:Retrovirus-related Pol poly from transposon n=1 Tax=Brachionus plicatilis TaxID=10195 RepID=A0A3M7T3I1_BRAPC|nr:Retrovirus-related Pol poly from transposon [Brachionus plicatilis]
MKSNQRTIQAITIIRMISSIKRPPFQINITKSQNLNSTVAENLEGDCLINDILTHFQIDTGSDITAISDKKYKDLPNGKEMIQVRNDITGADGSNLVILGRTGVKIQFGTYITQMNVYIIKDLNTNWSFKINFKKFYNYNYNKKLKQSQLNSNDAKPKTVQTIHSNSDTIESKEDPSKNEVIKNKILELVKSVSAASLMDLKPSTITNHKIDLINPQQEPIRQKAHEPEPQQLEILPVEQDKDQSISWIKNLIKENGENRPEIKQFNSNFHKRLYELYEQLCLDNDLLFLKKEDGTKVVVLPKHLMNQTIEEVHSSILGGHLGVSKTYDKLRDCFYAPKLKNKTIRFIKECWEVTADLNATETQNNYNEQTPADLYFHKVSDPESENENDTPPQRKLRKRKKRQIKDRRTITNPVDQQDKSINDYYHNLQGNQVRVEFDCPVPDVQLTENKSFLESRSDTGLTVIRRLFQINTWHIKWSIGREILAKVVELRNQSIDSDFNVSLIFKNFSSSFNQNKKKTITMAQFDIMISSVTNESNNANYLWSIIRQLESEFRTRVEWLHVHKVHNPQVQTTYAFLRFVNSDIH